MSEFPMPKRLLCSFLRRAAGDSSLLPTHLSLVMAVFYFSPDNLEAVQVSRQKLMRFSRIRSMATYHKCMADLQHLGYLEYQPSYHPKLASRIRIIDQR